LVGASRAPGLNAAAVDVVPQAEGDTQAARVGHPDQPVERLQVALLLLGGQIDHADVAEALDIKKVGIGRCEEAAVLVAEDHHQRIEPVLRQHVQVARPVRLVVKALLPAGPVHGVKRQRALRHGRPFDGVVDLAQRRGELRAPADALRHVEFGVHEAAVVGAGDHPGRLALVLRLVDQQRFRSLRGRQLALLEQLRGRTIALRQTGNDEELSGRGFDVGGRFAHDALAVQRGGQLAQAVRSRIARRRVRHDGNVRLRGGGEARADLARQEDCRPQQGSPPGHAYGVHGCPRVTAFWLG
jgi:hypothetical protein